MEQKGKREYAQKINQERKKIKKKEERGNDIAFQDIVRGNKKWCKH